MLRPKISIIIVNYNGRETIKECLHSVFGQNFKNFEVIVIDNHSQDGSPQLIKKNFPQVRLFLLKDNVGFARGNNYGYKRSRGRYIFLLNPDTILKEKDCLEKLWVKLKAKRVGAVAPKILFAFARSQLDSAGTDFDNLGFNWGRGFREKDGKKFNQTQEVFGATACAMIFKKKLIPPPLFDPDFFMYYEEFELSLRIREADGSIIYNPSSVIYHKLSATQNLKPSFKPTPFKQFNANINRTKIYFKYFPTKIILKNIILFKLSLIYWNLFFLKKGKLGYFFTAPFLEFRSAIIGLKERQKGNKNWLKFMVKHSLKDLISKGEE